MCSSVVSSEQVVSVDNYKYHNKQTLLRETQRPGRRYTGERPRSRHRGDGLRRRGGDRAGRYSRLRSRLGGRKRRGDRERGGGARGGGARPRLRERDRARGGGPRPRLRERERSRERARGGGERERERSRERERDRGAARSRLRLRERRRSRRRLRDRFLLASSGKRSIPSFAIAVAPSENLILNRGSVPSGAPS